MSQIQSIEEADDFETLCSEALHAWEYIDDELDDPEMPPYYECSHCSAIASIAEVENS